MLGHFDHYVINIDGDCWFWLLGLIRLIKRVNLVNEALLHAPLVGGANVLQAKRHGYVAVRTIQGDERGCELIGLFHHDLVIARVGIQKGEDLTTQGGVNYLVYARQRKVILRTSFVEANIINAHSLFLGLLFNKNKIGKPVGVEYISDEFGCQEFGDLFAYRTVPLIVEAA